jgi:hypothetical protein
MKRKKLLLKLKNQKTYRRKRLEEIFFSENPIGFDEEPPIAYIKRNIARVLATG